MAAGQHMMSKSDTQRICLVAQGKWNVPQGRPPSMGRAVGGDLKRQARVGESENAVHSGPGSVLARSFEVAHFADQVTGNVSEGTDKACECFPLAHASGDPEVAGFAACKRSPRVKSAPSKWAAGPGRLGIASLAGISGKVCSSGKVRQSKIQCAMPRAPVRYDPSELSEFHVQCQPIIAVPFHFGWNQQDVRALGKRLGEHNPGCSSIPGPPQPIFLADILLAL